MSINFTGRNIPVTDALRTQITKKLSVLHNHHDVLRTDVVLSTEKLDQIVEATLHLPHGEPVHAEAQAEDMYAAVDALVKKLERQLTKQKEKEVERRKS